MGKETVASCQEFVVSRLARKLIQRDSGVAIARELRGVDIISDESWAKRIERFFPLPPFGFFFFFRIWVMERARL